MILPFLDEPRPTFSMRAKKWYRAKHAIAAAHYEWLVWHVARALPSVPRRRKTIPICRRLDIIKTADLYSPVHHDRHHDDPCPAAVVDHNHPGSPLLALPHELLLAVVTALLDSESRSGRFYAARVLARVCPSLAAAVHFIERQHRAARLEVTLVIVADRWPNPWAFGGDGGLFAAFDCSAADAPKLLHAVRGGNCTLRVIPIDARVDPRTVVPLSWCVVPWCSVAAWPKRHDAVWGTLILEVDPLGKHLWKEVSLDLASTTLAMLVRALATSLFVGANVSARHVHVRNPTSIPLVTPALLEQLASLVRAPRWTVADATLAWDAPMPGAPLDGGAALTSLAVTASTISASLRLPPRGGR
ncbi:hypothetical protein AMAG_05786 [Allomyces macrogynus ATCC 38327]|uniref:Uncharacterized protein n=1 Tax=Allomyces macrogynus (strain ATCC 38327) TaxID=578462 RepID=A0A0L0SD41_ALLM3|nr:hypothetical protein AMAG_05786 [Allomyces macrogynus ATCC 38327]|eukprot:KNE60396.1 hypothetical protein AMAG_05786 [Allomyces macrogynus ATCC 38327]